MGGYLIVNKFKKSKALICHELFCLLTCRANYLKYGVLGGGKKIKERIDGSFLDYIIEIKNGI